MANAQLVVDAARACLGTPFRPQGRALGLGLDCAGLVIAAYAAAGIALDASADYPFPPPPALLPDSLSRLGFKQAFHQAPATVLLFRFGGGAQHLALASDKPGMMLHAYAPAGCVIETAIGAAWQPRLLGLYHYPGV